MSIEDIKANNINQKQTSQASGNISGNMVGRGSGNAHETIRHTEIDDSFVSPFITKESQTALAALIKTKNVAITKPDEAFVNQFLKFQGVDPLN